MKKRIVILGATGMLGYGVKRYFDKLSDDLYDITYTTREDFELRKNESPSKTIHDYFLKYYVENDDDYIDYVINCIGIIKPYMAANPELSIIANSLFPHLLGDYFKNSKTKVINITTDCVYTGNDGSYHENIQHDCLDSYGKSKSLGESNNIMNIRTSIIGEELHSHVSLLDWVRENKGGNIKGFTDHIWNGITTVTYGYVCDTIIKNDLHLYGTYHVFSPNPVTKFDLVSKINEIYKLGITIEKTESNKKCDRSLSTIYPLNSRLNIKDIFTQLRDDLSV